jgi:lysophospholipase L1-like esterase
MPVRLDIPARIVLAPLLIAQAIRVRRKAAFLPEPAGPRTGERGTGPRLRLLIIGDSSAAGVGATTQDRALSGQLVGHLASGFRVSWQLEAMTGATTRSTLERLSHLTPTRFDVVVVALGVNDVTRAVPVQRWITQQKALHDILKRRFNATHLVVSGVPPMGLFPLLPHPLKWVLGCQAARLDRALATVASKANGIHHVPVAFPHDPKFAAEDGFHPSEAAYAVWGQHLAGLIHDIVGDTGEHGQTRPEV